MTDERLQEIRERARQIIQMDLKWQWKETISIVGYSVFGDGVNLIPDLVNEILRLRAELEKVAAKPETPPANGPKGDA
mgnify:CR=1 FL=1